MYKMIEIPVNECNEGMSIELIFDYELNEYSTPCRHAHQNSIPRVVKAYNEAGCNSIAFCLDCLLEWVNAHRLELGLVQADYFQTPNTKDIK